MAHRFVLDVDAVLFDMDGTILDSSESVYRQWALWAERNGLDVPTVLKTMPGRRAIEVIEIVAPHMKLPDAVDDLLAAEERDMEGVVPIPGAREFIGALGDQWAVVTSATAKIASLRIGAAGLSVPRVLVAADHVTKGKPDPEGFLFAAGKLGIEPARCVVFEDAPAGVEAAKRGGMQVVGVTTKHRADELGASNYLANYSGLSVSRRGGTFVIEVS